MAQKRPRPRAPFVVTVAFAAAAGACGGSTSGDSGSGGQAGGGAGGNGGGPAGGSGGGPVGGSGGGGFGGVGSIPGGGGCGANPPSIPCPQEPPPVGSACPTNSGCFGMWWGTSCYYPDPCGGSEQLILDCSGTSWQVASGTTTCKCPASAPVAGSPCAVPETEACSYDTCAATGKLIKAACANASWSVTDAPCSVDAGTD